MQFWTNCERECVPQKQELHAEQRIINSYAVPQSAVAVHIKAGTVKAKIA